MLVMRTIERQPRQRAGRPDGGRFMLVDKTEADATLASWEGTALGFIPVVAGKMCPGSSAAAQFFYQDGDRMREYRFDRKSSTSHGVWTCHRCGGDIPVTKANRSGLWRFANHIAQTSRPGISDRD